MKGSQSFMTENWKRWLVAMRSAHLTAVSSWDNIMDQGFDMFLNLLGETKNILKL
ncbi:MAG TPA: hypothetical protein VMC85_18290 [Desulfomonilaceae bacterium]|nr:hypothetical protein [Desulfomonilaceae bacterium]